MLKKRKCYKRSQRSQNPDIKMQQCKCDPVADLVAKFHKDVSEGPLFICTCCSQLWYKHSVCLAERTRLSNPNMIKHLQNIISVDKKEWICRSCNRYLKKNKVPPCAITNGMRFPEKPNFFYLNELECRLLAPRLAFQKIMQAPRGKQLKINGNVVNVPADVSTTVNMLPRLPHENGTIKVQLKRKLQYKSSALSLNVRPHKVIQAASWLTNSSSLYHQEGITVNQTWSESLNEQDDIVNTLPVPGDENSNDLCTTENVINSKDDDFSEDEVEIPAGVTDTMLTATDFLDDSERQQIHNVAPGEGNRPLSIFRDQYSEELANLEYFWARNDPMTNND